LQAVSAVPECGVWGITNSSPSRLRGLIPEWALMAGPILFCLTRPTQLIPRRFHVCSERPIFTLDFTDHQNTAGLQSEAVAYVIPRPIAIAAGLA
jgi:hypothetical protein